MFSLGGEQSIHALSKPGGPPLRGLPCIYRQMPTLALGRLVKGLPPMPFVARQDRGPGPPCRYHGRKRDARAARLVPFSGAGSGHGPVGSPDRYRFDIGQLLWQVILPLTVPGFLTIIATDGGPEH